jgi:hypothetical protein
MIFFSYTRIVARVSLIPIIIVGVIGYILAKNSTIIAVGVMTALEQLFMWLGITFGTAAGIITAVGVMVRRRRYRSLARTTISQVYGVRTKQDIPVIDWTLKPQAIEPVKGVTINGIPIEEWQKQHP